MTRVNGLRRIAITFLTLCGLIGLCTTSAEANGKGATLSTRGTSMSVPGSVFRDCTSGCPEMVAIGSGHFGMGSTSEEEARQDISLPERTYPTPRHVVTIGYRFALGKYDVTRSEFAAFVHDTGYHAAADCTGYATRPQFRQTPSGLDWHNPGFSQTDSDPVVCVNWDDIQAYLAWLIRITHEHYRLPSEAEWEYAARAGTSTLRYWGNDAAAACHYENVEDLNYLRAKRIRPQKVEHFGCSDGYVYTSPVGSFRPNRFGLYDMLGDVKQFVADCWNYSYTAAPTDGSAWLAGNCVPRVTRGGSFESPPKLVRDAYRSSLPSFIRSDSVGFRVARNLR